MTNHISHFLTGNVAGIPCLASVSSYSHALIRIAMNRFYKIAVRRGESHDFKWLQENACANKICIPESAKPIP